MAGWSLQTTPGAIAEAGGATSVTPTFTSSAPGTLLVASMGLGTGGTVTPASAGWITANSVTGENSAWMFAYPNNPGGLTSVTLDWSGSSQGQACVSEWNPGGEGFYVNQQPSLGATNAQTLTVSTTAHPLSGDLALSAFLFTLGTASTVSWTTPASWTQIGAYTASSLYHMASYYYVSPPACANLPCEGQVATTQAKLVGLTTTFSLVPAAGGTASLALAATSTGGPGRSAARGGIAVTAGALIAAGLI